MPQLIEKLIYSINKNTLFNWLWTFLDTSDFKFVDRKVSIGPGVSCTGYTTSPKKVS